MSNDPNVSVDGIELDEDEFLTEETLKELSDGRGDEDE